MVPLCVTLSNIRYVSRVKWGKSEKGLAPSPTPWCRSYWKGSLWFALDYHRQLYLLYIYIYIGIMVRVFANDLGKQGSIPGQVIPKTQKRLLDASLLNPQHYKARIKSKWSNLRKGDAPSPTPWCCSYWKRSFRVTHDYGRQIIYIYIYLAKGRNHRTFLYNHLMFVCFLVIFCKLMCVCVCGGGSYSSAGKQPVYTTSPADWV